MKETAELMFDGILMECKLEEDKFNKDYIFVAPNGRFAKFPKEVDLEEAIARHNEYNSEELEVIEEVKYGDVITHGDDGEVIAVEKQEEVV